MSSDTTAIIALIFSVGTFLIQIVWTFLRNRRRNQAIRLMLRSEISNNQRNIVGLQSNLKQGPNKSDNEDTWFFNNLRYSPYPIISKVVYDQMLSSFPESLTLQEMTATIELYELFDIVLSSVTFIKSTSESNDQAFVQTLWKNLQAEMHLSVTYGDPLSKKFVLAKHK